MSFVNILGTPHVDASGLSNALTNKSLLRYVEILIRAGAGGIENTAVSTNTTTNYAAGSDIVFLGDSLTRGYTSTTPDWDGSIHRFKLLAQASANPPDVLGGYGFWRATTSLTATTQGMPAYSANVGGPKYIHTGTAGILGGNTIYGNMGGFTDYASPANVSTLGDLQAKHWCYKFDGAHARASYRRLGVTTVDVLALSGTNAGYFATTCKYWGGTADPVNAAGVGTTLDTSGTLFSTVAGANGTIVSRALTGATASSVNYVAAGVYGNGKNFFHPGVICYNGDESRGVRVHNLGYPGATLYDTMGQGAFHLERSVGFWHTFIGNLCAVVVNYGMNEIAAPTGNSNQNLPSNFKINMQTLITAVAAVASKPKVVLVIPLFRGDSAAHWARSVGADAGHPYDYYLVYKQLADENPDTVVLLDLPKLFGYTESDIKNGTYGSGLTDATNFFYKKLRAGYPSLVAPGATDNVHWANPMQPYMANVWFQLLLNGTTL